jgi:hypothetical protein
MFVYLNLITLQWFGCLYLTADDVVCSEATALDELQIETQFLGCVWLGFPTCFCNQKAQKS